jgi:hypothetical protein
MEEKEKVLGKSKAQSAKGIGFHYLCVCCSF